MEKAATHTSRRFGFSIIPREASQGEEAFRRHQRRQVILTNEGIAQSVIIPR